MGKGTKVVNQAASVPEASAEEKAMQKAELNWAKQLQPGATALNDIGMAGLGLNKYQTGTEKVFDSDAYLQANPDVMASGMDAQDHYAKHGQKEGRQAYFKDQPVYGYQQSSGNGVISPDYNALYKQAANMQSGLFGDYENLKRDISGRQSDIDNRIKGFDDLSAEYTPLLQQYQQGILPDEVKKNRYAYVSDWANNEWGNNLADAAAKGVVDTTVIQKASNDINKNADLSLAQTYSQDLTALNNIANQNLASRSGLLQQIIDNKSNQMTNAYNMGGGLIETGVNLSTLPIQTAAAAQEAQISAPTKLFALASGQQAPTTDAWKTLGNWRYTMASPAQTIVSQGNGGLFGGLMSGVGSYLGAKR